VIVGSGAAAEVVVVDTTLVVVELGAAGELATVLMGDVAGGDAVGVAGVSGTSGPLGIALSTAADT
jgi:hypothetical protein